MKLYHGTSSKYFASIKRIGLQPRGNRKGNWTHSVDSCQEAVYFTSCYGPYFCFSAIKNSKHYPIIIEIDTSFMFDLDKFVPDEDVIAQTTKGYGDNLNQKSKYWRERLHTFQATDMWKESLKILGTCAYLGNVPPTAISRVAHIKENHVPLMFNWDCSITIMNYRILGKQYEEKTAILFGDKEPERRIGVEVEIQDFTFGRFNSSKKISI